MLLQPSARICQVKRSVRIVVRAFLWRIALGRRGMSSSATDSLTRIEARQPTRGLRSRAGTQPVSCYASTSPARTPPASRVEILTARAVGPCARDARPTLCAGMPSVARRAGARWDGDCAIHAALCAAAVTNLVGRRVRVSGADTLARLTGERIHKIAKMPKCDTGDELAQTGRPV